VKLGGGGGLICLTLNMKCDVRAEYVLIELSSCFLCFPALKWQRRKTGGWILADLSGIYFMT
jgi:hypothetical protein